MRCTESCLLEVDALLSVPQCEPDGEDLVHLVAESELAALIGASHVDLFLEV